MNFSLTWADARNYVVALVIFLAIDMVWLTLIAKSLWRAASWVSHGAQGKARRRAGVLSIVCAGVAVLCAQSRRWRRAVENRAVCGHVLRACDLRHLYDLTNLATVKDWPVLITVIDLAWGSFVSGITSLLSFLVIRRVFNG